MKITEISVKRPLAVGMVFLGVMIFGAISILKLPVDLLPNIRFPMMIVMTIYPGAGPEEVESQLTEPLEKALGTVNNLDKITSSSSENASNIFLQFEWGTDIDAAGNDVRDRVGYILPYFPEDADYPLVFKFDISQQPVVMYFVSGNIDPLELEGIAEEISERLQRVGGVAASYALGETMREIQIVLDPLKMAGTGITTDQITNVLKAQNLNFPLGTVESGSKVYILRAIGQYRNLDDIGKTVVGNKNGVAIALSQIAEVRSRAAEVKSVARTNGTPSIWGSIQKRTNANSVQVGNAAAKEIAKIKKELPPGVTVDIMFNQADYITRSVRSTADTMVMGAILAILILFLFLGSVRSTIFVGVTIPITIFFSLFLMYLFRMTINIISLGGLTIAVGMVVDAAIVVFEAIHRHQERGADPQRAALEGTSEVGMAITASTLTTVAVFLPLLLVSGFASIFFTPLALTTSFALMSSLVVALTILPMLSAHFLKVRTEGQQGRFTRSLLSRYRRLEDVYGRIIDWALHHRKAVILGTIGVFLTSLVLIPFIGTELSPDTDRGEINITAEMPVGTNLAMTDSAVAKLERIVLDNVPEIEILSSSIGSGSGFTALFAGTAGPHSGQISILLVDREKRERSVWEIQRDLRPKMGNIPGLKVRFGGEHFAAMFGGGKPIEIKIIGYDVAKARRLSDSLMERLKGVKGLVDLETSLGDGKPELRLVIDRQKAANFGLTPYQIGQVLRSRIEGTVASRFRQAGDEYDIRIMVDRKHRDNLQKVRSMTIATPQGDVPLRNFVSDTISVGPVVLEHESNSRLVKVSGGVEGRDQGSVARDVRRVLASIARPPGFTVELAGGFEQMQTTFRDLGLVILLSLVLVYIIMVGQFESFREPFVIMFTIPLAIIGVLWMLFFSGTTISMQSLLGVLLLGGVVVNNAIVYIDYVNQLRRKAGMGLFDAAIEAGRVRLRPILMTALTTIFGLIPMALGVGAGNEIRAPMARSVIGGMLISTFLTLIFIPVVYTLFEKGKKTPGVGSGGTA